MTNSNAELHELAIQAALIAFYDCDGGDDISMKVAIAAYLAIAPQAPVSAKHDAVAHIVTDPKGRQRVMLVTKYNPTDPSFWEFGKMPEGYSVTPLYASPPPAQADDGKDAEIEHLKLEMDGVDNAKEEIGRLLGLTEEFRWKRISAAIHEQKRLIRELAAALTEFLEFGEYAYSHGREALAKAKAAGYSNEGKDNG